MYFFPLSTYLADGTVSRFDEIFPCVSSGPGEDTHKDEAKGREYCLALSRRVSLIRYTTRQRMGELLVVSNVGDTNGVVLPCMVIFSVEDGSIEDGAQPEIKKTLLFRYVAVLMLSSCTFSSALMLLDLFLFLM